MQIDFCNESHWVLSQFNRQKNMAKNQTGVVYTPMTKIALKIAFDAHNGHSDHSGMPYILHPLHLAERVKGEAAVCAALLHDVVEDTELTFGDLAKAGVSDEVIDVLKLLTHDPAEPYADYIRRIKESGNQTAIQIKLADLAHNSDMTRLEQPDDGDVRRFFKYLRAMASLQGENWAPCDEKYIYDALTARALDIRSDAPGIGGRLSNLTKRQFVLDGVECGSIEAVLQSFKFGDEAGQADICGLFGFAAKKAGAGGEGWKAAQTLWWKGVPYKRESEEYQSLLSRVYASAFEQDEAFRRDLRLSKGYRLTHSIGIGDPKETILTAQEFCGRLDELRGRRSEPDS